MSGKHPSFNSVVGNRCVKELGSQKTNIFLLFTFLVTEKQRKELLELQKSNEKKLLERKLEFWVINYVDVIFDGSVPGLQHRQTLGQDGGHRCEDHIRNITRSDGRLQRRDST